MFYMYSVCVIIYANKDYYYYYMSLKCKKANPVMGAIRRTCSQLDTDNFLLLYKVLMRPHVGYVNQV